jgi:hypothetical protein
MKFVLILSVILLISLNVIASDSTHLRAPASAPAPAAQKQALPSTFLGVYRVVQKMTGKMWHNYFISDSPTQIGQYSEAGFSGEVRLYQTADNYYYFLFRIGGLALEIDPTIPAPEAIFQDYFVGTDNQLWSIIPRDGMRSGTNPGNNNGDSAWKQDFNQCGGNGIQSVYIKNKLTGEFVAVPTGDYYNGSPLIRSPTPGNDGFAEWFLERAIET